MMELKEQLSPKIRIVAREDRASEFAGVRLLLASLSKWSPSVSVSLYVSPDEIEAQGAELSGLHPRLSLVEFEHNGGWACKPYVLNHALQSADEDELILWLDTDIIVLRPVESLLSVPHDLVITAEESNPNPNLQVLERQTLLNIPPGAARETTISSSVVGVRRRHLDIITDWTAGVETQAYMDQQRLPLEERLLFGDQEVWEAVLCSSKYSDVRTKILRNFNEMLQGTYTSYAPSDQRKKVYQPLFVHATGNLKPWRKSKVRLAQEVFPYFDHAQNYLHALTPSERIYFETPGLAARAIKTLAGFDQYASARRLHHRWVEFRRTRQVT